MIVVISDGELGVQIKSNITNVDTSQSSIAPIEKRDLNVFYNGHD